MQEKNLTCKSQMQDILLSYHKTGFFFMRVNPLVSEATLYLQEKMLGSKSKYDTCQMVVLIARLFLLDNPLKTAAMDLIFCSVFLLAGKADKATSFIHSAKYELHFIRLAYNNNYY